MACFVVRCFVCNSHAANTFSSYLHSLRRCYSFAISKYFVKSYTDFLLKDRKRINNWLQSSISKCQHLMQKRTCLQCNGKGKYHEPRLLLLLQVQMRVKRIKWVHLDRDRREQEMQDGRNQNS